MLLLVTILLVLVAAVTLLIGIFSDNLALIFISIGASALAAIVLAVLSQVSKRKGREATTATGPEPLPTREPATVGGRQAEQAAADIATIGEPVGVPASGAPTATMPAVGGALPIADYDNLRVNEILPKLDDLDLDQLETVAQHEENNKNRTTVLNRIDDLMDELEAQEAAGAPAAVDLTDEEDVVAAAAASIESVGEPVVATAASGGGASDGFPIPDFDELDEDELIERLEDLDADQLEAVADREEAGQNRDAVLDAIDDRLDILEGIVPAPAKVPARKAPAKKTTAKKATAKKATPPTATRKASAPTPVKKAAAKRAASTSAKKAAAPAKKTAAKATKAPAKKATAKKATASPSKATKKASTVKKAAPAKKATKKSSKR